MTPSLRDAIAALAPPTAPAPAGASRFEALVAFAASGSLAPGRGGRLAAALEESALLRPDALADAPLEEVVDALRDARIEANPKLVRLLQRLAAWYRDHREGLEAEPGPGDDRPPFPRDELAAINGVGRATADGIALHVFGVPSYPVDRATYRILVRHGWIDPTVDYDEVAAALVAAADEDPALLAGLSDAFEGVGRRYCKASGPRCEPCPLKIVLPVGGPVEVDG